MRANTIQCDAFPRIGIYLNSHNQQMKTVNPKHENPRLTLRDNASPFAAYSDEYVLELPAEHRFPMPKYALLQQQLSYEGIIDDSHWIRPAPIQDHHILRCHPPDYLSKLNTGTWTRQEQRKSGFPWSHALIERERIIMEGTRRCALIAAAGGVALNIAGGTHHAFADRAEGFCLLNDLAIAAHHLLDLGVARIAIIDLDVHQGNGTASMTQNEARIFTMSMHGANNYPLHKEISTLDIPLEDGTSDEHYLKELDSALDCIMETFRPEVLMYQCGVDVLFTDRLGRLSLTMEGCKQRDIMVFDACRSAGIGAVCAMGGGYSTEVNTIVDAHLQTFRAARDAWT